MMRNKVLPLYILFLLTCFSVKAQQTVGDVTVNPILLEERDDSLYLQMQVHIRAKAMNNCQSWSIQPELKTDDNHQVLTFPYLLINGKRKAHHYKRKISFKNRNLIYNSPYKVVNVNPRRSTTIDIDFAIPYEQWMDTARLDVYQILTSCAEDQQWFTLKGIAEVKTQPYIPYVVAPHVNYIAPPKEIKQRQMQGEAFLDFQVGKSVLMLDFKRNPVELQKIISSISAVKDDEDMKINGIEIEGLASPDGSYATNERLSLSRAMAVKDYLRSSFALSENLFKVTSIPEDWSGLRKLVEESSLSNRSEILSVIDMNEDPDRKEWRLKNMANYRVLANDFYPQLRRVNYRIDYTVRDYTAAEAETLIQMRPEQLSVSELFTVAETYDIDSDKFRDIISLSVLLYPDDILANINMAASLLERGDLEEAKRYLDKVNEDPRAYNNYGVYYLLSGDIERAKSYLDLAVKYTEQAEKNLEEVEEVKKDQEMLERRRSR